MTIQRLTTFVLRPRVAGRVIGDAAGAGEATGASRRAAAPSRTGRPRRSCPRRRPATSIGVDDVLTISVWREKELAADVVVLPDGKITLPLINEIQAAGLTVEELRTKIAAALAAKNIIADPVVSVGVKADQEPEGLHHRRRQQARSRTS